MNNDRIFSIPVILLMAVTFTASALILFVKVGPWEGVRHGLVGGILAASWISAWKMIARSELANESLSLTANLGYYQFRREDLCS
jgi:hypothetical protein